MLIIDILLCKYVLKRANTGNFLDICKKVDDRMILKKTHAIKQNEITGSNEKVN